MSQAAINPKVFLYGGQSWTDSLNIANSAGLNHADVVHFIKNLELSRRFKSRCFRREKGVDTEGHNVPLYWVSRDGFSFLGEIFPHEDDPELEDSIKFDKGIGELMAAYITALGTMDDKIFRGKLRRIKQGKCRGPGGIADHV